MFKEGAWQSMEPMDQGMVLGLLVGAVLALAMWQLPWIAVGVVFGIVIGHVVGRRRKRQSPRLRAQSSSPLHQIDPYGNETPAQRAERLRGGVDEELSAALKALREAWRQYSEEQARRPAERVPTGDERFLAEFGVERGRKFIAANRALHMEAGRVPDPGGPLLGEYNDALKAWADSHPEVDRAELNLIINRLLWEHR
ncbi:MAG: hypothetical protein ACLGHS_07140 [Actinomycetes bacterium]